MSTNTTAPPGPPPHSLALPEVYRMTVDEYERMAAAGVLDDPRVELINGYLVKKMGKDPPHIWAVDAIVEALRATLPQMWCRKEDPVRIADFDEPEPDVAVVRGNRDDYRDRIPEPKDVVLLVEVAESTLDRDRGEKRRAYASGGILDYWIINLVARQVEVYSNPAAGDYRSLQVFKLGDEIPVLIEGVEVGRISASDILPRS
ncbi:MAG: Uma2 family endonuclease [Isosphaeraceae bacterium]